ncbi:hypothetical protein WAI453_012487 [Rhynchosporium graminicola]|uniref:Uncharacterized protein n=1 Tax=Rhynchosporium graminicola TaxID=2792576 RepID=A0A1E1LQZ8_9HELO|nr:uncharacterized protein RCO7_09296 [Rhynchosporium commune]
MQRKPLPPYAHATEDVPNNSISPEIDISSYHSLHNPEIEDNRCPNKECLHVTSTFLTEVSTTHGQKTAKWGIPWLGEPLQIPLFTFLGIALAVAHHLVYLKLDGQTVGESKFGQQAVKQIGNVFVFLALASLKVAIDESYNQYIWYALRRKSFAIGTLDKLFTLPFRITAIFSLRLLGGAKIAALLGLLTWLLFLGGLTPAATLSVVPALLNSTSMHMVPVLDFNTSSWWQIQTVNTDPTIDPTAIHLKTATSAAVGGGIIFPTPPSANSSFSVQFHGPSIKCEAPDEGQKAAFNWYANQSAYDQSIVTAGSAPRLLSVYDRTARGFLLMSAFSPTQNGVDEPYRREDRLKVYNNWPAELGENYSDYRSDVHKKKSQIWVQTGDHDIVCSLINASFNVGFSYFNGAGTVTHQHIVVLPPSGRSNTSALSMGWSDAASGDDNSTEIERWQNSAYYATFLALGNNIFGNVSLENTTTKLAGKFISVSQASSRILQTDLAGCEEFTNSYWAQNLDFNTADIFPRHAGSCRNKTLDRAIEDLANNITISMLSVPGMTSLVSLPVRVSITSNVYAYEQLDLLVSYGATIAVALFCVMIGVICLVSNGVYHTTNFSAVMATTRNPDFDNLAEGACLGKDKGMMDRKIMFGVVTGSEFARNGRNEMGSREGELKHAAFGLSGTVMRIKKGTVCA